MLGERLLEACRDKIERFYQLTDNGSLEPIALMFRSSYSRTATFAGSELAGEQMSPELILQVLKITDQQKKSAQEQMDMPTDRQTDKKTDCVDMYLWKKMHILQRTLLKCTQEQLLTAMRLSIEEGDSIDDYKKLLEKHCARLENAKNICRELQPKIAEFHVRCGGSVEKIALLFADMAPEPAKGKPLPPGMIHALLRISKDATSCRLLDLVECFERNFDEHDTADKVLPYLEKTY